MMIRFARAALLLIFASSYIATSSAHDVEAVSPQQENEERQMHEDPAYPEHWHLEDLAGYYEDYYFHGVEDMSLSMPTSAPVDYYYYYYKGSKGSKGYKGKGKGKGMMGKGKGKGKSKSKGKKSKSHKKGKSKKHSSKYAPAKGQKGYKGQDEDGYYWYYYYPGDHDHEHHHGEEHEQEYYYYYYYYDDHSSKSKKHKGGKGSSDKYKGKGAMGKGKGKGKGMHPHPPTGPTATLTPTTVPTSAPTMPVPTEQPTEPGPSVVVDGYTITYSIMGAAGPDEVMLDELTQTTDMYIDEFLRANFGSGAVRFDRAETERVGFQAQAEVDFETTLYFFPEAVVPSTQELNNAVAAAFMGQPLMNYLQRVTQMPAPNVFRGATSAMFQLTADAASSRTETSTPTSSPGSAPLTTDPESDIPALPAYNTPSGSKSGDSSGNAGAGIIAAAGAGAFVLIIAGFVVYRRRSEEVEHAGKFIDPDSHMAMTVAGDTYTGDTYAGGESSDGQTHADSRSDTPSGQQAYRSETPDWKEYHNDQTMMSEEEWNEYQEGIVNERSSPSPFETIPEEKPLNLTASSDDDDDSDEASGIQEQDVKLPFGEDDDSFPERIVSELDDVTL